MQKTENCLIPLTWNAQKRQIYRDKVWIDQWLLWAGSGSDNQLQTHLREFGGVMRIF